MIYPYSAIEGVPAPAVDVSQAAGIHSLYTPASWAARLLCPHEMERHELVGTQTSMVS